MVDFGKISFGFRDTRADVSGSVERQIGEITGTLRAFHEDLGELKEAIENIAKSQRESSDDRRNQQQIITARIESLERTTSYQHTGNIEQLTRMATELTALKEPVDQFVSIRKRAGTVMMVLIGIGSVIWTLAAPVYQFVVTRLFGHP